MPLVTGAATYRRTVLVHALSIVLVVIAVGLMAGCGGDQSSTVAGRSNEAGERATKSTIVENQSHRLRDLMTQCDLVTKEEARAIFGAPIRDPLEAPQGPTCIYRAETGDGLVTLAVQSVSFRTLAPLIRQPRRIRVSDRIAYCGQYGQAMLYLPLSPGQVLSIAAPCPVARQFAARAVQRLGG